MELGLFWGSIENLHWKTSYKARETENWTLTSQPLKIFSNPSELRTKVWELI